MVRYIAARETRRETLLSKRDRFEVARFDLVRQLQRVEAKKHVDLAEAVLAGMYAQLGFSHQSHESINTLVTRSLRPVQESLSAARNSLEEQVTLTLCTPQNTPSLEEQALKL